MNLDKLYEEYISAGNSETKEQFLEAKETMGDDVFFNYINSQIDLKKKDYPSEEITPIQGKMAGIQMPENTNLPTIDTQSIPNPISLLPTEQNIQNIHQDSSVLGTTAEPISTVSELANGVSSLGENPFDNGEKPPTKNYKEYNNELKGISAELKDIQSQLSPLISQLNNINQAIAEKNDYIQVFNNNPIIKEVEALGLQVKNIDVNNVKNYEEEKAIERYNTLVGSSEFKALVENYNKGIEEINAMQNQYQDIAESESFKTLTTQEKNLTEKYNSILESNEYKQSIVDENKRLKEKVNTKTSSTTITTSNPVVEEPPIDNIKPSVNKQFYGIDANGETILISAKNFTQTDKNLIAKDGNTYPIYEREGLSFIDTNEGLKLVGKDGDVSQYPVFGRDFEFYKGKFLLNSEKEDQPTDYYQERRKNFHYVAGGRLSSGVAEKDISGNYISLEDETALYKSYESKGYGTIVGIDEQSQRPIFQLNEVGAETLNKQNGFSVPSDYEKGKAYALDNNRVMSNINEGKEIEDNERQRQERILGRKVDGALLTEEEINEELITKRTQQLVLQGLNNQQALEQAGREFASSQQQKRNETNNWIDYIISEAERNAEPYNASNGKSFKYHQFTNSERETWQSLRDDMNFAEFINSDYAKNKYGTKGDGLEYHFENSKLRKSFLNDYVQYKQKQINDNRRALNSTRDRQLRTDIRVAIDNGDDDALAVARGKREPIERAYQSIQQKALSNSILANKIDNGFDVIKKEDEELAKEYAGYQNGRFGDIVSYTGKSIINGGGKLITDIAGGLLSLGGMFSDRINSAHTAFNVENAQVLNILSGNTTDKVTVYKKGNTVVEERLGRMFIKGKDGKLTFSEELTYNPKAFEGYEKKDQYTDENIANWLGMTANQVGMMYIPSVGGGLLAKATANSARLNKVIAASANALGKEHMLTKSLVSFSHNSKNLYTSALWAMEVQNQNYNEAKNLGLTRQQAGIYSLIQSGLTGAMVHISPDDKFFKGYDAAKKELISLVAKGDRTKISSFVVDYLKKAASSNIGELSQEHTELIAQNIVNSAFNSAIGEDKLRTWEIDELFETTKSTLGVTTFLETFNYLTRGGVNTRGLNAIEKMVVASQIPEIQRQLQEVENGIWSSSLKQDARDALQYIDKIQKYTNQIPDDVQLKVSETASLVMSMDKIAEYEKKKNETTYPSIKDSYEEKIQAENEKIKDILSGANKNVTEITNNTEENTNFVENPNQEQSDEIYKQIPRRSLPQIDEENGEIQKSLLLLRGSSGANIEEQQKLSDRKNRERQDEVEEDIDYIEDENGINDKLIGLSPVNEITPSNSVEAQPTNENLSKEGQGISLPHLENDEYTYRKNESFNQDGDKIITIQKANKQDSGFGIHSSTSYQPVEEYGLTKNDILGLPTDATDIEVEGVTERKNGDREAIIYFKENGKTQREIFSIRKDNDSEKIIDEKGIPFTISPKGGVDFGQVNKETGLTVAPIRLSEGNKDYGLIHIEEKRGEDIRNSGFNSVIDFVYEVANNFNVIRKGKTYNNKQTYLFELTDDKNKTLFIELSKDGDYWNVNSAGSFRKGYSKNKEIVWSLPAVENETLTSSEKVSSNTPKGKQGNRLSGNSSQTISTSKDTKKTLKDKDTGIERSNEITETKSKDGYTYTKYSDGREVITSPKGTEISRYNKNGKVNANFEKNKAKIFGEKTNNEINQEYARRKKEALDWLIPTNARYVVLKFFAEGGKVSAESISKNVLGNSESLSAKGRAKRKLTDYKWAFFRKGKPHSIEATAERLAGEYDHIDEIEIRNEIIDVINSYSKVSDIQDEILDLYQKSNDPYYGYTDEDIAKMEYWSLSEKERALVDDIKAEERLTAEERAQYYTEQYYKQIQSLSDGEQEQIYREWAEENEISRAARQYDNNLREWSANDIRGSERNQYEGESVQGGEKQVGENAGSRTIKSREKSERPSQSGSGKESPEYRELLEQKRQAEQNEKNKKANLDRISKELNAQFQADQVDLFGDRASQQEAVLFDERADANAGRQSIEKAKEEYEQAKAETQRINRKLKDVESGKVETTGEIDFQVSEDYFSLSDRELKDEIQRISDEIKNDIAGTKGLLERSKARINHPLYAVWKELTDLKIERYQEQKKRREEEEKNNPRVAYTPKREELKISEYNGERTVYHGTKKDVADKIVKEGIKFGSELSDTDWRGGGYGVLDQEYFSTSLNPNISKDYSGEHNVGIVKLELNPNANVVTIENEIYAEDLKEYQKELEGVDAVYLKNSGEEELVILNKEAVKVVEAKSFKVSENVVRFHKNKNTPYKKGKISQKAFDKLIAKLKKPFAKAFENINILTDWEAFERKVEEYRKKKKGGADYQNVNEEFNKELDNFENGKHRGLLHLGVAGNILKSAGINVSITLSPSVLKSHLKKHGLKVSDLKGLAKALQTPNLIYQHGNTNIATVIVTDLEVNDKKISIALRLDKKGNIQELNNVSSVHGKNGYFERERLAEANNNGILKIKYIANKENVLNWLGIASLNGGSHTANPKHLFFANIIKNFQNPKIENDLEYMRTPSGVIYGAKLSDGTIYINPEHLNANTPIHEFGHIWEQLMPNRFAKGVELLKNTKAGKELFQELRNNKGYKNYSDEKLWSEVLVTMLGNRGEELYHSNSTSRFVAWVKDFFKALGDMLYKLSNGLVGRELTPEDKLSTFVKGALSDIMSGKEIIPESNIATKEVPIYLKDMDNSEIKQVLDRLGLIKSAQCA